MKWDERMWWQGGGVNEDGDDAAGGGRGHGMALRSGGGEGLIVLVAVGGGDWRDRCCRDGGRGSCDGAYGRNYSNSGRLQSCW